ARFKNVCRRDQAARQRPRSEQDQMSFVSHQTPERQRALFQRLSVRRSACVRITLRSRQDRDRLFTFARAAQGAVPETYVALPGFEIALGGNNQSELLSGFTLQRGQSQSARRRGDQSANRH